MTTTHPRIWRILGGLGGMATCMLAAAVYAHGNMTPQAVDTSTLPQLGAEWRTENPYRNNTEAIRIRSAAYTQNCALPWSGGGVGRHGAGLAQARQ